MSFSKTIPIKKQVNWKHLAEYRLKYIKTLKEVIERIGYISHVSDSDCPSCGFPEIIILRDNKTGNSRLSYCHCGWIKNINK
jgi:predicted RNA-binding Zn-ribbon protein involved in translation (DUF1610 family)